MKILIVGGAGREHALAWKLAQSPLVTHIYVAPGNAGTAQVAKTHNVPLAADDVDALGAFAQAEAIDLTVVGPEAPLAAGIVDHFHACGLACFGPTQAAARLETSKAFCKDFFQRHQIPTAAYAHFHQLEPALAYVRQQPLPIVIKADGLAAGKGVVIATTLAEAELTLGEMLTEQRFGAAGQTVVIEAFLRGEEASFIVITDGVHALPFPAAQDHKRISTGDQGANTGGMGAYAPAPVLPPALQQQALATIIYPTLRGMAAEGHPYCGFLYAGLMLTPEGQALALEFNCRLGDPEAQVLLFGLTNDLLTLLTATLSGQLEAQAMAWIPGAVVGVVLAAAAYPGTAELGDVINGLTLALTDTEVFHAGTAVNPDGQIVTAGGRVLCVCARGLTLSEAQQRAYQRVNRINWRGMQYRTDIGWRGLTAPTP